MQPDVSPPISAPAEAQWVEGELIRNLMQLAHRTQLSNFAIIPVFVAVLWSSAGAMVWLWVLAATLMALLRALLIRKYRREVIGQGAREHQAFFARYRIFWPLSGIVWGLTTFLYFDRASLAEQFICWLLLAGLAMFSINVLSNHLATMRSHLNAMALTTLAAITWEIVVNRKLGSPAYHYWLVAIVLIFWQSLRQAGAWLHATQRQNLQLQFRNIQLIESLTRQTQAALTAVATKNRFLASAAHDIRQPVHALGLYADWLRSEPELVHEIAPKIVESTKAVNALFDSLFDLARLDSGKVRLNIEPVDLSQLLRDLELQYRPSARAKGLELRLRLLPGTVMSDPILLQRIVGNLIANAIRYTRAGGILVAIRLNTRGRWIEVWDTGVGIAPEHQQQIFTEFFKVPGEGGTEDGFGLGLYIVARLAHILGHPLSLSSRPGQGTVFRLLLRPTDPQLANRRAAGTQLASIP